MEGIHERPARRVQIGDSSRDERRCEPGQDISVTRMSQLDVREDVTCNLCGFRERTIIFEERGLPIVRCLRCGLVYVSPRIPREAYNRWLLDRVMVAIDARPRAELVRRFRGASDDARLRKVRHDLDHLAMHAPPPGRLLDVGSGAGLFVREARRRGWEVVGIDLVAGGSDTIQGDFDTFEFDAVPFDVVTMWDVLEHLPDPLSSLKKAHSLLKDGGLLVVRVPNVVYLLLKLTLLKPLFGRRPYEKCSMFSRQGYFSPERHLYNFSPQTLLSLTRRAGFRPVCERFVVAIPGESKIRDIFHRLLFFASALLFLVSFRELHLFCGIEMYFRKFRHGSNQ